MLATQQTIKIDEYVQYSYEGQGYYLARAIDYGYTRLVAKLWVSYQTSYTYNEGHFIYVSNAFLNKHCILDIVGHLPRTSTTLTDALNIDTGGLIHYE